MVYGPSNNRFNITRHASSQIRHLILTTKSAKITKGRNWDDQELLPSVACSAIFSSLPVRNEAEDCSFVAICWFQSMWAMPIDAEVVKQIKKVDWEAVAINWSE